MRSTIGEEDGVDLFAVYLGGDLARGRMGEDHEVVFVVGDDVREARRQARAKWTGQGKAHVDAIQRLRSIDGHRISLEHVGGGDDIDLDVTYEPADEVATDGN
jgi:hypothetical protein